MGVGEVRRDEHGLVYVMHDLRHRGGFARLRHFHFHFFSFNKMALFHHTIHRLVVREGNEAKAARSLREPFQRQKQT